MPFDHDPERVAALTLEFSQVPRCRGDKQVLPADFEDGTGYGPHDTAIAVLDAEVHAERARQEARAREEKAAAPQAKRPRPDPALTCD